MYQKKERKTMDIRVDARPDEREEPQGPDIQQLNTIAVNISTLAEMLLDLKRRRDAGEISHAVYMNGMDIIQRLSS